MRYFRSPDGTGYAFDPTVHPHAIAMAEAQGWADLGSEPPKAPVDLRAYAAAKRYEIETGGIAVAGRSIDTSRASQTMIAGALAYVEAGAAVVQFKGVDGWATLSATEMRGLALAVAAHVQRCFGVERAVDAAIDAGSVTTPRQIDEWPWPSHTVNK